MTVSVLPEIVAIDTKVTSVALSESSVGAVERSSAFLLVWGLSSVSGITLSRRVQYVVLCNWAPERKYRETV